MSSTQEAFRTGDTPQNEKTMNPMILMGGALILIGIFIVGKMTYKFIVFIFKMLFGLSLIYLGYQMTQSSLPSFKQLAPWLKKEHLIFKTQARLGIPSDSTSTLEVFTIITGTGTIDLSTIKVDQENIKVIVNSIFSDATVVVNPNAPLSIHTLLLQGSASLSGANPITSGDLNFMTEAATQSKHSIEIQGYSLFGKLNFTAPPAPEK